MSFKVYPVTKTELFCDDYIVKINGKQANLNTARVSAVPFNRRWPGHQRQIEQTEVIQFLSLATDEPLNFEIIPKAPFDAKDLKIRPRSLGIVPEVTVDGVISFTLPHSAYFTVEPFGRNNALHIFADPVCDYEINLDDENLIYFGAGEHDVGTIELKSNQTLFLDEGAVVYCSVYAKDADNIRILGRGILDNSRNVEEILYEENAVGNEEAVNNAKRQHTVQLEYCNNVQIDGITIRDSLVYNIRPIGCSKLSIKNVKIIGCWRYNSDGIDMHNCVDVHISDCFLRTFDDSICVKGFDCYYDGDVEAAVKAAMYRNGKSYDVFKNVLVEKCVIWNDWGKCLEIGAETRAEEISNIHFYNCDLIHLTNDALDCMNVDYADVHDVCYSDIRIEADETIPYPSLQRKDSEVYENTEPDYMPTVICAHVCFHHEYSAGGGRRGKNRNMTFSNIRVYGDHEPRAYFGGYDEEHKTENILIEDLYWNDIPVTNIENITLGNFTNNIRIESNPYSELSKNTVKADIQLENGDDVTFENKNGNGLRVMFVGNSITRHGFLAEIGWYRDFGMAASSKDKDYVHLMESNILENDPNATFCICQVAEWELNYKNGEDFLVKYQSAREFDADVIFVRIIENCPQNEFDSEVFKNQFDKLLGYLNPNKKAKIFLSTGFWRHPGDNALIEYANEYSLPIAKLGDLGDNPCMKAIGLFEHEGVANHPGDEGMKAIADRFMALLSKEN